LNALGRALGSTRGVLFGLRYYHGGVANAPRPPGRDLGLRLQPGRPSEEPIYPWDGFRVAVIGDVS